MTRVKGPREIRRRGGNDCRFRRERGRVTTIYKILTIAGWAWAVVVAVFLIVKLRRRQEVRGFEVMDRHEE